MSAHPNILSEGAQNIIRYLGDKCISCSLRIAAPSAAVSAMLLPLRYQRTTAPPVEQADTLQPARTISFYALCCVSFQSVCVRQGPAPAV